MVLKVTYGFDTVGTPGIDMFQMYMIAPLVQGCLTYMGVDLVYKAHNLYAGMMEQ